MKWRLLLSVPCRLQNVIYLLANYCMSFYQQHTFASCDSLLHDRPDQFVTRFVMRMWMETWLGYDMTNAKVRFPLLRLRYFHFSKGPCDFSYYNRPSRSPKYSSSEAPMILVPLVCSFVWFSFIGKGPAHLLDDNLFDLSLSFWHGLPTWFQTLKSMASYRILLRL